MYIMYFIIFLVFDPNEKIDESNPEFKAIHDEYKNLVNF